jgi:hypothetical protein
VICDGASHDLRFSTNSSLVAGVAWIDKFYRRYSVDPGIDFITSATIGTFTQYPNLYGYSAGQAQWSFPTVFSFGASGTVACALTGI